MKLSTFLAAALVLFLSTSALAVDCTKDSRAVAAKNTMGAASDEIMCGNAAQFYAYLCECRNNPRTDQQAANLESTLHTIRNTYNSYGAYCRGIGRINDSIPKCMGGKSAGSGQGSVNLSSSGGGGSSVLNGPPVINSDNKRLFNSDVMNLVNSLAADSHSPGFQRLANEMNKNAEHFQSARDFMGFFGPLSQKDHDMINMYENLAQGIAIGVALFGKPPQPELTEGQREARRKMGELNRGLRLIFNEVATVPTFFEYDESVLARLEEVEGQIGDYERATAKPRLWYWMFLEMKGDPEWRQLEAVSAQLDALEAQGGTAALLARIAEIQKGYDVSNVPHLANADRAFAGVLDRINLEKAKYYDAVGQTEKAQAIRSQIQYDVPVADAVRLIQETYNSKDYYSALKYHQVLAERFAPGSPIMLHYLDAGSLDYNVDLLGRSEANFVLALGVLANLKSGQISAAHNAMEALNGFQADMEAGYKGQLKRSARAKAEGYSDEKWRVETDKGRAIALTAEAYLLSKTEQTDKALAAINEAFELEKNAPSSRDSMRKFQLWMKFTKAEILVASDRLDEAKELLQDIKRNALRRDFAKAFSMEDVDYLSAYIRYRQGDHKGALMAARIMERKYEPSGRIYGLQEQIHEALGDPASAAISRDNYQKLLSEDV